MKPFNSSAPSQRAPASFSRRVQSVFARSATALESRADDTNASSRGFSSHIVPSLAATKAVSTLTCVSDADGKRNLDAVAQHVIEGGISMFELSAALFPDDDCIDSDDDCIETDSYTCLCNLALLIQKGYVGIGDIDVLKVRQRAIFEACNTTACRCGELVGVQNTIESVLNTGRSHARDKFLEAFLCGLLNPSQLSSTLATKSLVLVKPTVKAAQKILGAREINHHLSKWAHVAVFQKTSATKSTSVPRAEIYNNFNNDDEDDEMREYWTTELRDLAIGQNAALHLMNKTDEESALLVLFNAMGEHLVISLVSQMLTTICSTSYAPDSGNSLSQIMFARFCTLVRHAGALGNPDDEDDGNNSLKILETSFMSTLCSFQAAACKQNLAMVVTLARFFYIGKEHTVNDRYVRYEKWFLSALKTAPKPAVKLLLEILANLLPLDPLPYLKAQMRCFRRVPAWMQLAQEYNTLARTRIRDLEPNDVAAHHNKTAQKAAQSMEDTCRYVAQFHRNDDAEDSVPKALVRFMNFHRYAFRENILPLLLAPEMNPPQEIIDREFALGGVEAFDKQRIALIRILAYKRMDKAVRKDEADKCIPKIQANIRARKDTLLNQPAKGRTEHSARHIDADSSAAEVFLELCSAATEMEKDTLSQKATTQVVDVDAPETLPKKVRYRGIERWTKADELLEKKLLENDVEENVPQRAADLLQLITDQVQITAAEIADNIHGNNALANGNATNNSMPYFDSDRNQYRHLWDACQRWMVPLLVKVLSRRKLMGIWQNLKFIAIANISFQSHNLGPTHIVAIAILVFATVKCSDEAVQLGLPFLHKGHENSNNLLHVVDAIQDNLPVDNFRNVGNSLAFATHYLMLVLANGVHPRIEDGYKVPAKGPDGTYFWNTQENHYIQSEILPRKLIALVRWTCSQPWRLKYNRAGIFTNKNVPSFAVIKLLRRSLAIIERHKVVVQCSEADKDKGIFNLTDWTRLEIRAGWGRHEKIPDVFAKFAGEKGKHIPLAHITQEIAEAILNVHAGTQKGGRRFVPSWILLGLSGYARSCRYALQSHKEKSQNSQSSSFARCINDIFRSEAATGTAKDSAVGYMMVEISLQLPPYPFYFMRDTVGDIFMHIHLSLSPRFWPFSALHLDFLLDAMIASDAAILQAKERRNTIQSTPAFVASIGYHSAISGGKHCPLREKVTKLVAPEWATFRKEVATFCGILRKILTRGSDGQDDDVALGTQALATQFIPSTQGSGRNGTNNNNSKSADARSAVQYHPEIVAFALLQSVKEKRGALEKIRACIEWLVGAVGELLVADVLDVAIEIAAQIPFTRPEEDETLLWSNAALAQFIPCRILLCRSAQAPYWMNGSATVCDVRRIPGCVFNTRRLVGIVEECGVNDEHREPNGSYRHPSPLKKARQGECATKIHALWHARIAGAFAKLDDAVLEESLRMARANNNNSGEEGVLAMLARALEDLRGVDLRAVMRKLANLRNSSAIGEEFVRRILTNQATGIRAALERLAKIHNEIMDAPVHADVINKVRKCAPDVAERLNRSRQRVYHIQD